MSMLFLLIPVLVSSFNLFDPRLINKDFGVHLTKSISSMLAGADHTGQHILDTNRIIIHKILDSDCLDQDLKKELSLLCIKFAQFGDHTGHVILEHFHNLVEKYL